MRQLASSQLKDAMQRLEAATRNLNDAASDLQNPSLDMKDRVLQLHCSSRAYLERAEHLEKLRGDLIDLDLREPPPGTCLGKVERLECPNILGSEA